MKAFMCGEDIPEQMFRTEYLVLAKDHAEAAFKYVSSNILSEFPVLTNECVCVVCIRFHGDTDKHRFRVSLNREEHEISASVVQITEQDK